MLSGAFENILDFWKSAARHRVAFVSRTFSNVIMVVVTGMLAVASDGGPEDKASWLVLLNDF